MGCGAFGRSDEGAATEASRRSRSRHTSSYSWNKGCSCSSFRNSSRRSRSALIRSVIILSPQNLKRKLLVARRAACKDRPRGRGVRNRSTPQVSGLRFAPRGPILAPEIGRKIRIHRFSRIAPTGVPAYGKFVDSPLEGDGFEPSVPRHNKLCVARLACRAGRSGVADYGPARGDQAKGIPLGHIHDAVQADIDVPS